MAAKQGNPRELVIRSELANISIPESSSDAFNVDRSYVEDVQIGQIHSAMLEYYASKYENTELETAKPDDLIRDYLNFVHLSVVVDLDNDDEYWPYSSITLDLIESQKTCLCISLYETWTRDGDLVCKIIQEALVRQNMSLVSCRHITDVGGDTIPYWSLVILPRLEATVNDAFELRALLEFLVRTHPKQGALRDIGQGLDWTDARKVLLAGFPSYLLGQEESSWLEVKSREYESGAAGDIELSQDVARFANGDGPGLLVIGFREERKAERRLIAKVVPVSVKPGIAETYHKVVDRLIFPPVRGLQVDRVPVKGGSIIVISVPEQDDLSKPFLVTGAMIDGKCEGAFISIVRRRGEHSIPISPAAIHAALSAGRAIMRRAESGQA